MTVPAYGTPPEASPALTLVPDGLTRYTIGGFFGSTGERFSDHINAPDPETAEKIIFREQNNRAVYEEVNGHLELVPAEFYVTGVYVIENGVIVEVSRQYATFLDPDIKPHH